jgi:hypothetical protein
MAANTEVLGMKTGDFLGNLADFTQFMPIFDGLSGKMRTLSGDLSGVSIGFDQMDLAAGRAAERAEDAGTAIGTTAADATGDAFVSTLAGGPMTTMDLADVIDEEKLRRQGAQIGESISTETLHGYATGIDDSSSSVQDEWKQFIKDMNKPFDANKEIAKLNGELTGKKLAEGLASTDPITRMKAETMRDNINAELARLKALGYNVGDATGNQVAAGINASTPAAVAEANQLKNQVNAKLEQILNNVNVRVAVNGNYGGEHNYSGGGRALGGPVEPNSMHEVTEGGVPELLSVGGRTYLLMGGKGGQVKPINGPGGGGGFGPALPPIILEVKLPPVMISAREVVTQSDHYRALQIGLPRF